MTTLGDIVTIMNLRSRDKSNKAPSLPTLSDKDEADGEMNVSVNEEERGSDGDYDETGTERAKRGEPKGSVATEGTKSKRSSRAKGTDAAERTNKADKTTKSKKGGPRKGPPSKASIERGRKRANDKYKQEKLNVQGLGEKIKARDTEIEGLKAKLRDKEETIVALQVESHAHIANQEKPLYPDDEVRRMFQSTFRLWEKFSRKWAAPTIAKDCEDILARLHCMLVEASPVLGSNRAVTATQEGHIGPYMLLNALLARIICHHTFEMPLGFLKMVKIGGKNRGLAYYLEKILELGSRHSPAKAAGWRASTIALLNPPEHRPETTSDASREQEISYLKHHYCLQMIKLFQSSEDFKLFLRSTNAMESTQRQKELLDIYRKALDLALRLLSQNIELKVTWFKDLHDKCFSGEEMCVRPHPRMHVEEDDEILERFRLDLIIEPKIEVRAIRSTGSSAAYRTWYTPLGWSADNYLGIARQDNDNRNGNKVVGSLSQPNETQRNILQDLGENQESHTQFDFSQCKASDAPVAKDRVGNANVAPGITTGRKVENSIIDRQCHDGAEGSMLGHFIHSPARVSMPHSKASLTSQVNETTDCVAHSTMDIRCSTPSRKHSRTPSDLEDTAEHIVEKHRPKRSKQEVSSNPAGVPRTSIFVDLTSSPCRRDERSSSHNFEVRINDGGHGEHTGNISDVNGDVTSMQATEAQRTLAERHNHVIKTVDYTRELERVEEQKSTKGTPLGRKRVHANETMIDTGESQDHECKRTRPNEENDVLNRQAETPTTRTETQSQGYRKESNCSQRTDRIMVDPENRIPGTTNVGERFETGVAEDIDMSSYKRFRDRCRDEN